MTKYSELNPSIQRKMASIRGLCLDVDGVLTDGQITYTVQGDELKAFHAHDGWGLQKLRSIGIKIAIITGRTSEIVDRRAPELEIQHIYQGAEDKVEALMDFCNRMKLEPRSIAYIGDDIPDLPVFEQVGLAVAVPNAVDDILEAADIVTTRAGGHGAVREFCELLYKAQEN